MLGFRSSENTKIKQASPTTGVGLPSAVKASLEPALEIRTRDSPIQAPKAPGPAERLEREPTPINKRKAPSLVDLTGDDSDEIEIRSHVRKKSRSASDSSQEPIQRGAESYDRSHYNTADPSATPPTRQEPLVSSSRPVQYASKSTKSKAKRPGVRSRPASEFRGREVSAIRVPPSLNVSAAEIRRKFLENLGLLDRVTLVNTVDDTSPPLEFRFVRNNILGAGVQRTTDEFMSGCNCRKDNGRNIGCEYTSCECLEDSQETHDGRKVFPYAAGDKTKGCLRKFYLSGGYHIYECNQRCNCLMNCKNRVVQHGRKVPLQIFKTPNRGWGLLCTEDLREGEFVDTYRGELVTHEEAESRGKNRTPEQENYLFTLDRFGEQGAGYVCDGMYVGGPTRFMNHSCDPNCRIMTVSYNHADINIYDLAFFTTEPVPAGTELTFHYGLNLEDDDAISWEIITDEMAIESEKVKGYKATRCLCGATNCRRYFFT